MKRIFLVLVVLFVIFSAFHFINKLPLISGKYAIEWAAVAQQARQTEGGQAKKVTKEEVLNMMKPVIKRQAFVYEVVDLAPDEKDPNISIMTISTKQFIQDRIKLGDSLKDIARNLASYTGTSTKVVLTQTGQTGKPKTVSEVFYNLKKNTTDVKFF